MFGLLAVGMLSGSSLAFVVGPLIFLGLCHYWYKFPWIKSAVIFAVAYVIDILIIFALVAVLGVSFGFGGFFGGFMGGG